MLEQLSFYYDGIHSVDMGLVNCRVDESNLFQESLIPSRNINEIKTRGRDKAYFQDLSLEPLQFNLTFAFSDSFDSNKLRYVARWLNQSYYKPLYFSDRPDRIFYCMPVNETQLNHNGFGNGYVTLTMRCNGAYAYTNVYTTPIYTSSSDTSYLDIQFNNIGDTDVYPTLFIDKTSAGNVEVFNETTNQLLTITDLVDGESITIDCEREMIKTNLPFTYRYNQFNDEYLRLSVGLNKLQIKGNFKLYFRNYFKIMA